MRPGAGLGVTLESEGRRAEQFNSLQGVVEQRAVRGAHLLGQALFVHREAVVLAGDHDLFAAQVLHRVIRAVVSELHFHGLRTGGEGQQLVTEADSEHRHLV